MDDHWKALYPIISLGGKVIAISTPNGKQGWFYDAYHTNKKGDWHIYKCNYKECPEFNNESWETEVKNNLGEKGWRQEFLQEFLYSSAAKTPTVKPQACVGNGAKRSDQNRLAL